MNKKNNIKIWLILGAFVIASFFVVYYLVRIFSVKDVTTSEFLTYCGVTVTDKADASGEVKFAFSGDKAEIDTIVIDSYNITGYKDGRAKYKTSYARSSESNVFGDKMVDYLASNGIKVDYSDPNSGALWSSLLLPLSVVAVGVIIVIITMRSVNGGGKSAMDFGKTKTRVSQNVKVRFTDVAGAEEEKQELQEIVEFLKNPKKFSELGARIPKGVLLVGPPGTGKTLFAKAVAGEANVPFFSISGSDFVEMFVGVGASRVRDLFATAKKNMPCIVFIDEIDAVGRQRGAGLGGGNDEREQTLNQLLVQMDGFDANEGIIIMAATNRADILDPALMRPGRFDRQIYVNIPDVRGREAILKVHARNKPLEPDVNFKVLARMTAGFSGADLANLLNEAAILAARGNRHAISNIDLYEAINKVIIGPQKKSRVVTETDKRITAYHESGHAILARLLPGCDPVQEVSIIPRGMAAGYTMTRPDSDDNHLEKSKLLDDIVMTLGGRVAEEIIIKDISAGASNDISVVTDRARKMVTEWGMSDKIGPVNYSGDGQVFIGKDMQTRATYSEELAKVIDLEVESIIKDAHKKATELLSANKTKLDNMARLLVERETIYQDEVDMIMDGKSADEIMAVMAEKDDTAKTNPFVKMEQSMDKKREEKLEEEEAKKAKAESENSAEVKPSAQKSANKSTVKKEAAAESDGNSGDKKD